MLLFIEEKELISLQHVDLCFQCLVYIPLCNNNCSWKHAVPWNFCTLAWDSLCRLHECNCRTLIYIVFFVQVVLSDAQASLKQQYGAIREALEQEEQTALKCVLKEENRVLGGLEEKLSLLRNSLQSIQNGLHTLESLADAKGENHVQDQAFIMVSCMQKGTKH